ncbi:MAG: hypothetical protein ACJAVT_001134 [Yoonia sp.]|jgi:hypothetical protein
MWGRTIGYLVVAEGSSASFIAHLAPVASELAELATTKPVPPMAFY